jgi:tRNA pseudouridine55 synthase
MACMAARRNERNATATLTDQPISGLVNLYKPVGWTSAKYAYRLRPIFGIRKVGHAGTLDPFADGVIVACIGSATRWVERLMGLPKRYRTTLRMGVTNVTFDPERPFEPVPGARPPPREAIDAALSAMQGEVMQTPPDYSAVRVAGRFSYQRVKAGETVVHAPRPVRIDRIDVLGYEWPRLELEIDCGRGTYIRAIARDLGEALGCGACCEKLTRMAVGPFEMASALDLTRADPAAVRAALVTEIDTLIGP